MWKLIERRFRKATKLWLSKPGNMRKHVDFLEKKILNRFSDSYNSSALSEALDTFKDDPDAGTDRIFSVLEKALQAKFRFEMKKGEIFATVTTRGLISWGRKAKLFGVKVAAETAILRKMDSFSMRKALDLFEAYFRDSDG